MIDLSRAPFPTTIRELWLPRAINGNASLPSSRYNGHPLTLTGARKGTTCDGVHFDGSATSEINCGAINNNVPKLWVSLRFKLDQTHDAAAPANKFIWGKYINGNDYIWAFLSVNGLLYVQQKSGGGADKFSLNSTTNSWTAGVWYHLIFSISDTAGGIQRLLIDNALEDSDIEATFNAPNGGNIVIGDYIITGGTGFIGVIADVIIGTDDLTTTEETDLYKGVPPVDAVNEWLLDEGRGVTAYDRGSGGNNGTLDTTATWAWGNCKHPVLSLDGINDRGVSSAGLDIGGDFTLIWVAKMKSTYDGVSVAARYFLYTRVDVDNFHRLNYASGVNAIQWQVRGAGPVRQVYYDGKPSIDDYMIFIGTDKNDATVEMFVNGFSVGTNTAAGASSRAAAIAYIGSDHAPAVTTHSLSKPLFIAHIDGAFTQKQALAFSRWLDNILGMGIGI